VRTDVGGGMQDEEGYGEHEGWSRGGGYGSKGGGDWSVRRG